jgi:aryl-alcohol dehydrogenase-like predicted oxidoreductase
MENRILGTSGLEVPVLALGTGTFGGGSDFFRKWGSTGANEATRLVDLALEAGCTLFDTADAYSGGLAETILGQALRGRREQALIATKTGMRMGPGPNRMGTSRERILRSCEASLKRLGTDHIDLYQLHAFDAMTAVEEMLDALDTLVRAGKIRYFGVSNYSGWHLMKMLAAADRLGLPRPVSHQAYYSLADREYEWELMPLALDQKLGTLVWSPLAMAKLSGKLSRRRPAPEGTRASTDASLTTDLERLYAIVDVLEELSSETGHSVPQLALAWLLTRPTISSLVIGARDEVQLKANLAAAGIRLDAEARRRLEAVSAVRPVYPYWHQRETFAERNPPIQ